MPNPKTQTYIRRQTNISYEVLQSCIMQLVLRQWLREVAAESGQRKLAVTEKGMDFLEKWMEIQNMIGIKNKRNLTSYVPKIQPIMGQSK